ncbi:hypothetical protein [Microviridae sp.]|nr:hypothetical protein [Microviridae sp.]
MERPTRYGSPDPEQLDTTPMEMPLGAQAPTPLHEIIARMVRQAVDVETNDEHESFDEANDFEEEDEATLDMSPYTLVDMEPDQYEEPEPEPAPAEEQPGDPPDPDEEEPSQP